MGWRGAERAEADTLMEAIADKAGQSQAFDRPVWRDVALPAARGVYAHARRDWAAAARNLTIANPRMTEIGGSHAQRDLFGQILLDAHLKLGNSQYCGTCRWKCGGRGTRMACRSIVRLVRSARIWRAA